MTVEIDGANNIIKTNTISEVSSANGVTVDGLSIKDSKLVTADSVIEANMSANSVDSDSYVDGSIDGVHLSSNVITGQTALTSVANDDLVLLSDTSGSATLKKMTVANLVANAGGGNSKLFEGTFGSQTSGTISLSSIGFTPKAVHCIFAPNDTTNAKDVDNISIGFGVKTGSTSSDMAVAYNYFQQSASSAFDASPNVIGRLAFGGGTFSNLTITAWNNDDCTVTKLANGTPTDRTLKYAIMVTG